LNYTNLATGSDENGGYIYYGLISSELNASYEIYNIGKNKITIIERNTTLKAGRVKAPSYFKDNNWHCWDTKSNGLQDIICQQLSIIQKLVSTVDVVI